ncbi:MAG TPA: ABC transporter ATP-binding protein [Xanthobacteraceae bacterium]|nr:ABC transporter ATP-binding protein [Xanthobacteraceae bacterium]
MAGNDPLLSIRDVSVRFGGIVALDGVSFDVARGQICGLIGPNGAGKTTLFNCISRLYAPDAGAIVLGGRPLFASAAHEIAALGIGRTFQNLALFRSLTVRQNVLVGAHARRRAGFVSNGLRLPFVRKEERELADEVGSLLDLMGLLAVADASVEELPFGTRKRVELARALAGRPCLLLLDEPAGGLNHEEVDELGTLILALRQRLALTVLLVEHHMGLVMRVSDKVVALDFGRRIAEGAPAQVQAHPDVVRAYLGAVA